jgi:hypothetical protein
MITGAIRRGLLANFPAGTPLAIVSPDGAFDTLVAERNDAATSLHGLGALAELPAAAPHVIVEGLDAVDDPVALLAGVRAAAPHARLFALVANGAHLPALAAYFNGAPIAPVRPLVRADIERALDAAGWKQIALNPIAEDVPFVTQAGGLSFRLDDDDVRERSRPAALLAIADPQ